MQYKLFYRSVNNNKETFLATIKANEGSIYKIASIYTDNAEDRADLVQEIVYQLWRSFGTFSNRSGLNTWIYQVAMNVAIGQLKTAKRKVPTIPIDDHHFSYGESCQSEDAERWKLLKQHIDKLNLLEKGIVLLYLEDKGYEEIAEIVGISVSNVGTKLSRIKEKLRQQISKQS